MKKVFKTSIWVALVVGITSFAALAMGDPSAETCEGLILTTFPLDGTGVGNPT